MAKKFTHSVCGRAFRTRNGLNTHVLCTPLTNSTPAPAQSETAHASELEAIREIKAELAATYMSEGVPPVRAKIRANREVREALALA